MCLLGEVSPFPCDWPVQNPIGRSAKPLCQLGMKIKGNFVARTAMSGYLTPFVGQICTFIGKLVLVRDLRKSKKRRYIKTLIDRLHEAAVLLACKPSA